MFIEYNLKNLENLCADFFYATGINLSILDSAFNVLFINKAYSNKYCALIQSSEKGRCMCANSDKKLLLKCKETISPQHHICKAGLLDIAVPILQEKEIIGYIILGQIKTEETFKKPNLDIESINASELQKEYLSLPKYTDSKIHSTISIASILAKHLLIENIIKVKTSNSLERVLKYIEDNLSEDLSIKNIAECTFVSKSSLYVLFNKNFNMTIGEYINNERIKKAEKLLSTTDLGIEDISIKVGFSSQSYFSKTFKRIKSVSPKVFRKNLK